jgi:hypothetical protein
MAKVCRAEAGSDRRGGAVEHSERNPETDTQAQGEQQDRNEHGTGSLHHTPWDLSMGLV